MEDLDAYWFEEPIAPEDLDGYRELRAGLKVNISGGEAEFNRWGWRNILENRGLDIAQPEVCALGGVSEYLRVLALVPCAFYTRHQSCLGKRDCRRDKPATSGCNAAASWRVASVGAHAGI